MIRTKTKSELNQEHSKIIIVGGTFKVFLQYDHHRQKR